ncbi:MAG: hypothetical protein PHI85_02590 [Victivallaceae bacterium]|nr:hypothetical protein [Victivallaceae bacterium]
MFKGLMVVCGALMLAGCCGNGSCPLAGDKPACQAKQSCTQEKQKATATADDAAQQTAKKCANGAPICTTEQTK